MALLELHLWSYDGLDGDNTLVLTEHVPYGLQGHVMCGMSAHIKRTNTNWVSLAEILLNCHFTRLLENLNITYTYLLLVLKQNLGFY